MLPENDRTVMITMQGQSGGRWIMFGSWRHGEWHETDQLPIEPEDTVIAWAECIAPFDGF